jgi:glutamate dehydrogenase (NAD(P)+)
VVVSYFEWIKNLSHVRFGRLEKRFEEHAYSQLLTAVAGATGAQFSDPAPYVRGPAEEDLVNSGLEETMVAAYQEIREIKLRDDIDLRTAAFVDSIDKVGRAYEALGIFP